MGNAHGRLGLCHEACPRLAEPIGIARFDGESDRQAGEQCGGDRLCCCRVGNGPAGRRIVQCQSITQVARGGDRRRTTKRHGYRLGDGVGAAMTAEQRHRHRTILGNGNHRRLDPLVSQQRRHGTQQNAGGADPDDRCAGSKQAAQVIHGVGEGFIGALDATDKAMQARAGQQRLHSLTDGKTARAEHNDGGTVRQWRRHRPDSAGTRINEK